jgi:hypothetical protein
MIVGAIGSSFFLFPWKVVQVVQKEYGYNISISWKITPIYNKNKNKLDVLISLCFSKISRTWHLIYLGR